MKILLINRYGYPEYGCENYFVDLCRLLKQKGQEVVTFTTKDQRNIEKEYSDYFVDKIKKDDPGSLSLRKKISYAIKSIYSFEAKAKIAKLIKDTRPDIVHVHNIKRLISASILRSIKKSGIPVVYTLHDYHLICPNYRLFSRGKICEDCKGGKFYKAVLKRCVRNSTSFSLLACIEQYAAKWLHLLEDNVDMFVAPSIFMRNKMIEFGMDPEKIIHIPNFIFNNNYEPGREFGNYVVYSGRIVEEKGLRILIEAMKRNPQLKLVIIGDGAGRKHLEETIKKENISNVEFKGYLSKEDTAALIKNAICVVVPSLWFENSPMIIYESLRMGKPVIAANIGGIPELIDSGINGFLFSPGDSADLSKMLGFLFNNKNKILEMGQSGRNKAIDNYSPDIHYEKILQVYRKLTG